MPSLSRRESPGRIATRFARSAASPIRGAELPGWGVERLLRVASERCPPLLGHVADGDLTLGAVLRSFGSRADEAHRPIRACLLFGVCDRRVACRPVWPAA